MTPLDEIEASAWADFCKCAPPALGAAVERAGPVAVFLCPAIDHPQFNRALGFEGAGEADVDAAVRLFSSLGVQRFLLQMNPGAIRPEWLSSRGLERKRGWAKFVRGGEEPAQAASDLDIAEVRPAEASRYGALVCRMFGMPEAVAEWNAAAVGRPGWRQYFALDGGTPAGSAVMFIDGAAAWLGVAFTIEGFRRRGGQSSLIARRLAEGIRRGVTSFVTETDDGSPSQRNVARAAFRLSHVRENWGLAPEPGNTEVPAVV